MASQGCAKVVGTDRFISLPPEVAHHILSFLPIADVTRVGSLSKSCRGLYLSNPTLNFTELPYMSTCSDDSRLELLDSLDWFFFQRGNTRVQSFSIDCDIGRYLDTSLSVKIFYRSRVMDWIRYAVSCDVDSLTLVYVDQTYDLKNQTEIPTCLFACWSLRSLIVNMMWVVLKASLFSTSSTSNLVCLRLANVTIEDDMGFCKWLSYSCISLKTLDLARIRGLKSITIEIPSLESFRLYFAHSGELINVGICGDKLEKIDMLWYHRMPKVNCLNIFAPNLKKLRWEGSMMNRQSLGDFNCVNEVELSLTSHGVEDLDIIRHKFLWSIRRVKVLVLDIQTVETLFREQFKAAPFYKICYLYLHIWNAIDDKVVPHIVSLLRGVPKLNTLHILQRPNSGFSSFLQFLGTGTLASGFHRGCWKLQGLDFVSELKEMIIQLMHGSNGFELAMYILEHAQNLNKMVIIYAAGQSNLLKELRRARVNSNAIVVFQKSG